MNGTIMVLSNGEWREIRADWWNALEGPKPPYGFKNDGCTIVHDFDGDVALWPACVIHDWHYSSKCSTVTKRMAADTKFGVNTYRIQRLQDVGRIKSGFRALKRFVGVRRLGGPFFKRRG